MPAYDKHLGRYVIYDEYEALVIIELDARTVEYLTQLPNFYIVNNIQCAGVRVQALSSPLIAYRPSTTYPVCFYCEGDTAMLERVDPRQISECLYRMAKNRSREGIVYGYGSIRDRFIRDEDPINIFRSN